MDRDEVGHDDVGHPESPNEQPRLGLYNIDDHLIINDQKKYDQIRMVWFWPKNKDLII